MLLDPEGTDLTRIQSEPPPPPPRKISSASLLGPGREVVIVHNGKEYRLRITQNGKLILTA
jgi:hemin uptake protein HemP